MAPKSRSYQISATPAIIFSHLLFIAITTLVLVWLLKFRGGFDFNSIDNVKIFNIHPLLMVIGFILIAGEAIMSYKTVQATRKAQKAVHLILHLIALLCGILGIYAVFKYNHEAGYTHMVTLHSWSGIITISLFGLQWLLAFFSFVFPRAESYARASIMPWHVFVGIATFFLAVCTAEMGLSEQSIFFDLLHGQEALIGNFTGLLLFLFAASVGLSVILPRN